MKRMRWIAVACCALSAGASASDFFFGDYATRSTGSWAQVAAVGDVNGDQLDDVIIGTTSYFDESNDHRVFVYLQQPDRTLAAPQKYQYAGYNWLDIVLADLDHDGVRDIVACHAGGLTLLRHSGVGFARVDAPPGDAGECTNVAVIDIDRDGNLDMVAETWSNGATIYYGDGHGGVRNTQPLATDAAGYDDLQVGDVTGDGLPDLVLASVQAPNFFVYPNNGKGGFAPVQAYPSPNASAWVGGAAIGDFNHDGRNDVAVSIPRNNPDAGVWIYSQQADGRLGSPVKLSTLDIPSAMVVADVDHDRFPDLLVGHNGWGAVGRYMGGPGGLGAEALTPMPYEEFTARALAAGDVDDDGCTDVVIATHNYGMAMARGYNCVPRRATHDFDGDGISDLLWRNHANGANGVWPMALFVLSRPLTAVTSLDWRIAGVGDFDGDGRSDILWHRNVDGSSVIWRSADANARTAMTRVTDPAWDIVGVGDFDGDGRSDVLWRNGATGRNAIWKSGNSATQQTVDTVTDTQWHVVGVDDFDGDGRADIVWRHAGTGQDALWLAGSYAARRSLVTVTNPDWIIAATGDFDGNGQADLLWRNPATGDNAIWRGANATSRMAVANLAGREWAVTAGDYDGNGKADLFWRNTETGADQIWRAAQASVSQPVTSVTNPAWDAIR